SVSHTNWCFFYAVFHAPFQDSSRILTLTNKALRSLPAGSGAKKSMALKATVFKANLQIADMERHYYQDHALTLAQHPSETDERMMVRLLAFALHAEEYLEFGQGMTDDEEADLWRRDLTGSSELWIDVGIRDEKLIRKACGWAGGVIVYFYGCRGVETWYDQIKSLVVRIE